MEKKFRIETDLASVAAEAMAEREDVEGGMSVQTQWSSWSRSSADGSGEPVR